MSNATDTLLTLTTTPAAPVQLRIRRKAKAKESRQYRRTMKAWAKCLAALEQAARDTDAFLAAFGELPHDETHRHFLADVCENAEHVAYGLNRDISLLESSAPQSVHRMVARIIDRLA